MRIGATKRIILFFTFAGLFMAFNELVVLQIGGLNYLENYEVKSASIPSYYGLLFLGGSLLCVVGGVKSIFPLIESLEIEIRERQGKPYEVGFMENRLLEGGVV